MKKNLRMKKNRLEELHLALDTLKSSVTQFAKNVERPDGGKGVRRQDVYGVLNGTLKKEWLDVAIDRKIAEGKKALIEYYNKIGAETET